MTRDFATDPEVAADLALQAATLRDPTRTKGEGAYDWRPPAIVAHWPCRGCGQLVDMPAEAVDAAKIGNRALIARGEKPLTTRELAVCEPCRAKERVAERARDQARAQSVAALTAELRRGAFPWREAAIVDELRGMGVDAREVLRGIAVEKQATAPSGARRKSL